MHADDPVRRRFGEERALCLLALGRRDRGAHRRTDGVVGGAGQRAVGGPAVQLAGFRRQVDQRGGHQCGVDVDAAEVDRRVPGSGVQLGAARQPVLGPARFVPAVRVQDLSGHSGRADGGEQLGGVPDTGEVDTGQVQPGRGGMDVRVDERGRDEGSAEIDDLGAGVQRAGRSVLPDPHDGATGDRHRRRVRPGRGVDAPAEQERRAVVHGDESASLPAPSSTWGTRRPHAGRFTSLRRYGRII